MVDMTFHICNLISFMTPDIGPTITNVLRSVFIFKNFNIFLLQFSALNIEAQKIGNPKSNQVSDMTYEGWFQTVSYCDKTN